MHVFHTTEHLQQTGIFPLPNIIKLSRRRLMPRFRLSLAIHPYRAESPRPSLKTFNLLEGL